MKLNLKKIIIKFAILLPILLLIYAYYYNYITETSIQKKHIQNSVNSKINIKKIDNNTYSLFLKTDEFNTTQKINSIEFNFPVPLFTKKAETDAIFYPENCRLKTSINHSLLNGYFDANWYLKHAPDVKKSGIEPWEHYLKHGWKEGRSIHPNFVFDALWYQENYSILDSNIPPLLHYIIIGRELGWKSSRSPSPKIRFKIPLGDYDCELKKNPKGEFRIRLSKSKPTRGFFFSEFYRLYYPDIFISKIDPWEHYLKYGWKEYRIPNPDWIYKKKEYKQIVNRFNDVQKFIEYNSENHKFLYEGTSSVFHKKNGDKINLIFETTDTRKTSRLSLIKAVWGDAKTKVVPIFIFSFLMASLGMFLFFTLRSPINYISSIILFFLSLITIHSIISPPFFAPDEEYHLDSFFQTNDNDRRNEIGIETARVHLGRLMFQSNERIDAFTEDKPYPIGVRKSIGVEKRSLVAFGFWKNISVFFSDLSVIKTLIYVRLIHGVFWILCLSFSLIYLLKINSPLYTIKAHSIFFIIPVLPHFSTAVSDYAFVSSLGILTFGIIIGHWFRASEIVPRDGLILGIISSLWILSQTSTIMIFLPIIITIFYTIIKLRLKSKKYLIYLLIPISITIIFFNKKIPGFQEINSKISSIQEDEKNTQREFIFYERLLDQFHLISTWGIRPPRIPNREALGKTMKILDFSTLVALHLPRLILPVEQDSLLSKTYWIGLGWQEIIQIYPSINLSIFSGIVGLGYLLLILRKKFKPLLFLTLGIAIIWVTCIMSEIAGNNVQGRYLMLGYYFLIGCSGFGFFRERNSKIDRLIIILFFLLSQNSLWWISYRYYG